MADGSDPWSLWLEARGEMSTFSPKPTRNDFCLALIMSTNWLIKDNGRLHIPPTFAASVCFTEQQLRVVGPQIPGSPSSSADTPGWFGCTPAARHEPHPFT